MLTVAEAFAAILQEVVRAPAVTVPLEDALGLVLAEDVFSDEDSPLFDKALMDGFAVRSADIRDPGKPLEIIEEVMAGHIPERPVGPGEATRIMTGAPLPAGADAVVQVEETRHSPQPDSLGQVVILNKAIQPGANILARGAATRRGERVLPSGRLLRAQEVGALAELGRAQIRVYPAPRVGVLATGDELVPAAGTPGPGQIRNSNEPMLAAQVRRAGGIPVPLGIARDERAHLRQRIEEGLECDVLLLSGGVSAGKLDLVPSELKAAGVYQVFHKVQMKPGKPLWFGVRERSDPNPSASPVSTGAASRCYVFGLPGNPVSSMVCCELFVRSALRRLMGIEPAEPVPVSARLTEAYRMQGNRPTYHPARLDWQATGPVVRAVDWVGSADLRATVDANAMLLFPAGEHSYAAGDSIEVFPW